MSKTGPETAKLVVRSWTADGGEDNKSRVSLSGPQPNEGSLSRLQAGQIEIIVMPILVPHAFRLGSLVSQSSGFLSRDSFNR